LETAVLKVDASNPDMGPIRRAAAVIRAGGLVAFPTETVYGLGANALDAAAVARIFEAKGRPATNPVIVHVLDAPEARNVASNWPETASKLAGRFWPGPLTLVVPKSETVPPIVTAGGETVAVRCPNHPVARALIREAGVPIAAPSANRSTELSPTRAEHVLKGLNGRIDLLLDGGPCSGGIESTVVDLTGDVPRVLRPGLITVPMLEEVCGRVEVGAKDEGVSRSPGQMAKHYSPRAEVWLCDGFAELEDAAEWSFVDRCRAGVIEWNGNPLARRTSEWVIWRSLPSDPREYAARLYDTLHELDQQGVTRILVEMPPDTPEWAAVRDRLARAAAK
jgi:L-threonylcarbamoyladenylate synthase